MKRVQSGSGSKRHKNQKADLVVVLKEKKSQSVHFAAVSFGGVLCRPLILEIEEAPHLSLFNFSDRRFLCRNPIECRNQVGLFIAKPPESKKNTPSYFLALGYSISFWLSVFISFSYFKKKMETEKKRLSLGCFYFLAGLGARSKFRQPRRPFGSTPGYWFAPRQLGSMRRDVCCVSLLLAGVLFHLIFSVPPLFFLKGRRPVEIQTETRAKH